MLLGGLFVYLPQARSNVRDTAQPYEVLLHNESSAVKGAYGNMATQTLTASVGLK